MFDLSNLFQELFERIVEQCMAAGLVEGEQMSVDGSFIMAGGPPLRFCFLQRFSLSSQVVFLSGEVQENLSLLGCLSEFKLREQARAVIVGAPTEHAEDGVQDLTGDGHQGLEFGFAACQQSLIKSAQMGIVAHRD